MNLPHILKENLELFDKKFGTYWSKGGLTGNVVGGPFEDVGWRIIDKEVIKRFLNSSQLSLLEEVRKIIDGKLNRVKVLKPETNEGVVGQALVEVALEDILKDLTIKEWRS